MKKTKHIPILIVSMIYCISLAVTAHASPIVTNAWEVDFDNNAPVVLNVWRGDVRALTAQTGLMSLTNDAMFYWQSTGMQSLWYSTNATVAASGDVSVTWDSGMDAGDSYYTFFFRVGGVYCPRGTIKMQGSPGATPNVLPLPELITLIDFDVITPVNAPWTTPAAVSNIVDAAGGGTGSIDIERDPVATPIATNALAIAQAAVPKTRTVNGKPLSSNVSLGAADVFAMPYLDDYGIAEGGIRVGRLSGFGAKGVSYMTENGIDLGVGNPDYPNTLRFDYDGFFMQDNWWLMWPTNNVPSPIATLADINKAFEGVTVDEADPLSVHTAGGTMTGPFKLAQSGITFQGVNIETNFTFRAEWNGTNLSFNVYMEAK